MAASHFSSPVRWNKPAAIDFGPDYTPDVLNPEAAQSYEARLKGALLGGVLSYQLETFLLDFSNLVVSETDSSGAPVLRNAGGERLKGVEFDTRYQLGSDVSLAGNFAYHDARFTKFIFDEGGTPANVSGNQLTLAPHILAAAGLLYSPPQGFYGNVLANYVGRRYLDERGLQDLIFGEAREADAFLGSSFIGRCRGLKHQTTPNLFA